MVSSYSSRQKKVYEDYSPMSDAKLQSILDHKNDYYSDIIPVIEDILQERGLIEKPVNPVQVEPEEDKKPAYIRQCIFKEELTEPVIKNRLETEFHLSEPEAENSLHSVYFQEKELLKQHYFLDQPTNKRAAFLASINIAIGFVILVILPFLKQMPVSEESINQWTCILEITSIVVYLLSILLIVTYSKQLHKNRMQWVIAGILIHPVTLLVLAYSQCSYPAPLQKKIEPLRKHLREQLGKLNTLDDNYIEHRNAVKQKIEEKFYTLLFDALILNNHVPKTGHATKAPKKENT
jgi:uncharacterized membrane protein YhaH (DUF805 family)